MLNNIKLCSAARDAFKSFDKKSEDKIKVGDIEAAMKRIGHNIKPDWLEKIEHMIDAEGSIIDFVCWCLIHNNTELTDMSNEETCA